jgi:hypothetical protein
MSLLTVVQDVCAVVGVTYPTSVFAGITGNRTMQEMLALANEMVQRIAYDGREWTRLKKTNTFMGDGSRTDWDLPANYKRMLKTANVWRSTNQQAPMSFVPDTDEWINRRDRNYTYSVGEWTMLGGQMLIYPALGISERASFTYLDKNCVSLTSGGVGDFFRADADGFVLNERMLKLGMIWQWKAQKGSPYGEDMGTYEDALAVESGADRPAPTLIGRRAISVAANVSYPWILPTSP